MTDLQKLANQSASNQNPNPTPESDISMYDEFTQNLVTAMLGVSIEFIKIDKRDEMVEKCKTIFKDFMFGYFKENFGEMDLIRLKASQTQPTIFEKFPDMISKFESAYQEFLNQLELSWKEEEESKSAVAA